MALRLSSSSASVLHSCCLHCTNASKCKANFLGGTGPGHDAFDASFQDVDAVGFNGILIGVSWFRKGILDHHLPVPFHNLITHLFRSNVSVKTIWTTFVVTEILMGFGRVHFLFGWHTMFIHHTGEKTKKSEQLQSLPIL